MQEYFSRSNSLKLLTFIMFVFLLVIGKTIILPLVVAVFIWFLISAFRLYIKHFIEKTLGLEKLSFLSMAVSVLIIFALIYSISSIISSNVKLVLAQSDIYDNNFSAMINAKLAQYNILDSKISQYFASIDFKGFLTAVIAGITSLLKNATVVFIYVIFLLLEEKSFRPKLKALSKDKKTFDKQRALFLTIGEKIKKYLAIKTLISISTALISYAIMSYVGLQYADFWAVLILLLNYIPTFGSIAGSIIPIIIAMAQFTTATPILIVAFGISLTQIILGNFVEPKVMGKNLNLSPVVILLSLSFWGAVWGITGMFLCVPLMVIILLVLSEIPATKNIAIILSEKGDV